MHGVFGEAVGDCAAVGDCDAGIAGDALYYEAGIEHGADAWAVAHMAWDQGDADVPPVVYFA